MPSRAVGMSRGSLGRRFREARFFFPGSSVRRWRNLQRGQASLEVLIVLILLIPLIFGAYEISRGVAVKSSLDSGVGIAVRALSVDPTNWGFAANAVSNTVAQNVFGVSGLGPVNFEAYTSTGVRLYQADFAALVFGDGFYIEAWVQFSPEVPLLPLAPITLRARHYGIVERVT